MTATMAISRKGQRLFDEGKVRPAGGLNTYIVEGDHDEYTVGVYDAENMGGVCPCPAYGPCSHLFAACLYVLANPPEPEAPLTEDETAALFDLF
jgi:uncharacterized Zn finger protein